MFQVQSFGHLFVAVVILSASIGARLWLARDMFYRTSQMGLLQFQNFRSVLGFQFLAGIVRVASLLGIVIGLGFIILAFTSHGSTR